MLLRSQEAACSARLAEGRVAHDTLEIAIQRVFSYLRSDVELGMRERTMGVGLAVQRDSSTHPIWCEVCEERLLAHRLVERETVEQLRDCDEEVEYWHRRCEQKGAVLREAAQNLKRLEQQVLALGGSVGDYPPSEEAEHYGSPEGGDARGLSACPTPHTNLCLASR